MRRIRMMELAHAAHGPCEDARCGCGRLLARVVAGGIELKCRRCKATWRLSIDDESARAHSREARAVAVRRTVVLDRPPR